MEPMSLKDLSFFERGTDFSIVWKHLPHWVQAGTVTFVTWRLADSFPVKVLEAWQAERDAMLRQFGLDPLANWKEVLGQLSTEVRTRIRWQLFFAWDRRNDQAAGSCLLLDPELSQVVLESLKHFDGERYVLTDAVVMPNHVHLLVAFREQETLFTQCRSWKHFTANAIRTILRKRTFSDDRRSSHSIQRDGPFWQTEQFDHLVRSEEQFVYLREYIALNPVKAGLKAGTYRHYSREL